MRAQGAMAGLVVAMVLAGCAAPQGDTSGNLDGDAAWVFTSFDGARHEPSDPAANATVLFFMATWCTTCQSKAPVLTAAYDDFAAQGVRFLSIDFDPSESHADVAAWQERYGHPWPHGLDVDREVQRELHVTIQSTVIVLDAAGDEVERFGYGKVTEAGLSDAIARALAA